MAHWIRAQQPEQRIGARKPPNLTLVSCAAKRQVVVMLRDMDGDSGDSPMAKTLYMVVEHFKNKDAVAVYRRFRDSGRLAPECLRYVSSWVDESFECCYQLMETHERALLDRWMANWSDLVDFEVHPVMTSNEAAAKIAPRL